MKAFNGVATAVISDVNDPMNMGRVRIRLSARAGGAQEWARVATQGHDSYRPSVNDQVVVAFENGDVRLPFVIGNLQNADQPPPGPDGTQKVRLPTGPTLHAVVEPATTVNDCVMTADLQRQAAPWLASAECLLKILALLKPLIDIVQGLPTPPAPAVQKFSQAAAALAPCFRSGSPAAAIPLVRDLLCLSLRSLQCLSSERATASQITRAASGIQGVLDLAAPFFNVAGIAIAQLGIVNDPSALTSDIRSLQSMVDALGGCDA